MTRLSNKRISLKGTDWLGPSNGRVGTTSLDLESGMGSLRGNEIFQHQGIFLVRKVVFEVCPTRGNLLNEEMSHIASFIFLQSLRRLIVAHALDQ